jgi:hypothetical protein
MYDTKEESDTSDRDDLWVSGYWADRCIFSAILQIILDVGREVKRSKIPAPHFDSR